MAPDTPFTRDPRRQVSAGTDGTGRLHPGRPQPRNDGRYVPTPPGLDGLRGMYERYCDQEARALLQLIPREGLRELSRRARQADTRGGRLTVTMGNPGAAPDPMARLVQMARTILPLPPYRVWLQSYLDDRFAYLAHMGIASAPERAEPVLVDVRPVAGGWTGELHLSRCQDGWRGFIQFTREGTGESHRTTEIFRGADPRVIRERFWEYGATTLEAFLRSVLP